MPHDILLGIEINVINFNSMFSIIFVNWLKLKGLLHKDKKNRHYRKKMFIMKGDHK